MATFVISTFVTGDNKLNIVHVQNATLAGGVGAGAICNLLIGPHGALLIGILAGTVATLGYRYLTVIALKELYLIKYDLTDILGRSSFDGWRKDK